MNDRGSIMPFTVVVVASLIACAGLAVDGGRILAARRTAAAVAAEAARRASEEIALPALVDGLPSIDPVRAETVARAVLAQAGADGSVAVGPDRITVTAHLPTSLTVLGPFGIGPSAVSATRSATAVAAP